MSVQPVIDEVEMLLEGVWTPTEIKEISEREVRNDNGWGWGGGQC
jgi:hypothetical protein